MVTTNDLSWLPGIGQDSNLSSTGHRQIQQMRESTLLTQAELIQKRIVFPELEQVDVVDAYRELRTKMLQDAEGHNRLTLVVGATPATNSHLVALNLAATFAFDESKTALVIDADLRNPQLDKHLDLHVETGLTDFLEQSASLDAIIYPTGIPRLRLIPVGHRREQYCEYFSSLRMRALLDVLKRRYSDRHIFINAPTTHESANIRILSSLADQVILAMPYGEASASQMNFALDAIGRDKLLGVLVDG